MRSGESVQTHVRDLSEPSALRQSNEDMPRQVLGVSQLSNRCAALVEQRMRPKSAVPRIPVTMSWSSASRAYRQIERRTS